MISSLQHVHTLLTQALHEKVYLGLSEADPQKLVKTPHKTIPLHRIYASALDQIESGLQATENVREIDAAIHHLRLLENDGDVYYTRYCEKTNTWTRWLLKGIESYAPQFLKFLLPKIFANGIQDIETKTKQAHEAYKNSLKARVDVLTLTRTELLQNRQQTPQNRQQTLQNHRQTPPPVPLNLQDPPQPVVPMPPAFTESELERLSREELNRLDQQILDYCLALSLQDIPVSNEEEGPELINPMEQLRLQQEQIRLELQKRLADQAVDEVIKRQEEQILHIQQTRSTSQKNKAIERAGRAIKEQMAILNAAEERPLSYRKFIHTLSQLERNVQLIYRLNPETDKEIFFKDMDLDPSFMPIFDHASIFRLLNLGQEEKLIDLLKPTPLAKAFEKAAQNIHIKFGIRNLGMQSLLALFNEANRPVNPNALSNFKDLIQIGSLKNLNALKELESLLKSKEGFRPHSLEISLSDEDLSLEALTSILNLTQTIPSIALLGLREIDLKKLKVTAEQEKELIESFSKLHCPQLQRLILTDHDKFTITSNHFSKLLQACPTFELMQQCLLACPTPSHIEIPRQLTDEKKLNLSRYPLEIANYLLSQWPSIEIVKFDQEAVNSSYLENLYMQGYLQQLSLLDLSSCKLTTDVLFTLTKLPLLTMLGLPELTQGTKELADLPKFDNPFKINTFYTQAALTRPYARDMYTGPLLWSTAFQIPLARAGETHLFAPNHLVLDPNSVANWLHLNDYRHLQPQAMVQTIVADNVAKLNDQNLVGFVQKFPNVQELSLHNCPDLTNEGISNLLKACPHLKKLDLTGCLKITNQFLVDNQQRLSESQELTIIVSDTSIAPTFARTCIEDLKLGNRLICTEASLKITNEMLADDDALERILSSRALNQLVRLDLEDCTNLTDAALGKLLDRLNTDQRLQDEEGNWYDNPQRLNIAFLNLKGCTAITDKAFEGETVEDKVNLKILNSLAQIAVGNTKLSRERLDNPLPNPDAPLILERFYPQIIFQETLTPLTLHVDLNKQLHNCRTFIVESELLSREELALKKCTKTFLQDRTVIEIFVDEYQDEGDLSDIYSIKKQPVDIKLNTFKDIILAFSTIDEERTPPIPVHRELLYSQSGFFRDQMRPGKEMARSSSIELINQNAKEPAVKAIIDLMHGKDIYSSLDWQTAGLVAELASERGLDLPPIHYKKLLDRIHSQFTLEQADAMLLQSFQLHDEEGRHLYEGQLIELAQSNYENVKVELVELVKNHNLVNLGDKLSEIEILLLDQQELLDREEIDFRYAQQLQSQFV